MNALADRLMADYPRAGFAAELTRPKMADWAEESVGHALKTVYHNLDPEVTKVETLPEGYERDATNVARRRGALAGYRLADELKRLFGEK